MDRGRLLTVPNTLSLSRFVLAGAFMFARDPLPRVALIAVAALSDVLDGWIARWTRTGTRWGALLDPVADRAFMLAAFFTCLVIGELTLLQVIILLLRDIMTAVGFVVARNVSWLRPITFRARIPGKLVTVGQVLTLLAAILAPAWVVVLVPVVGVLALASIADYTLMLWRERAT
jgi:phosphatidylglycerophosphate synthase